MRRGWGGEQKSREEGFGSSFSVFLSLGLPSVNWAGQGCCWFYLRFSLRSSDLPLFYFRGLSRPGLLATSIWDSFPLFYLPNTHTASHLWPRGPRAGVDPQGHRAQRRPLPRALGRPPEDAGQRPGQSWSGSGYLCPSREPVQTVPLQEPPVTLRSLLGVERRGMLGAWEGRSGPAPRAPTPLQPPAGVAHHEDLSPSPAQHTRKCAQEAYSACSASFGGCGVAPQGLHAGLPGTGL